MTSTEILWMVYHLLPVAFFADLLVLPFSLWWLNRWRKARARSHRS